MKRLQLLRHAKSSWELAGQLDYERGLTDRGRDDCALIAEFIREHGIEPDLIICSGARRTRATLEGVAPGLPKDARVEFTDDLYRASLEKFLAVLQDIDPEARSVMVIGHNPSIHDVGVEISAESDELVRMAAKFPTCALAEFEFHGKWSKLSTDDAELKRFTTAKQLRNGEKETI